MDMPPGSPAIGPSGQAQAEFMTPKQSTATLEFPVAVRDVLSTPTLILPPAPPAFGLLGSLLPLKKLHSGKLQMSIKASTAPGPVHVDVGCLARQVSSELKARHDLETKRLEMSAEGASYAGEAPVWTLLYHTLCRILLQGFVSEVCRRYLMLRHR